LIVGGVEPELSRPSQGWHITVYYTPVESFYGGKSVSVTGCLHIEGSHGKDHLGTHPGVSLVSTWARKALSPCRSRTAIPRTSS
jgi:hypothetical protein